MVIVVEVGRVVVVVLDRVVVMRMRVLAGERRVVAVRVMAVVMAMHVVVLDGGVEVAMVVALGQVEVDAEREQQRGACGPRTRPAIAERHRERGADERRQREHAAGAAGADPALREQVEP